MQEHKSSAEIERDIDRTRRHADTVLTELEQRLSPDRLMNDAVHFFRDNPTGREMVHNLKASVVANPLPLMLVAVGLGWMMMEGMRARTTEHSVQRMQVRRRMLQQQPLARGHHMHVEDHGASAHPGRGPTAAELTGQMTSGVSAAEAAEAFKGDSHDTSGDLGRPAPSILGPDGQPLPGERRSTMH